MWMNLAQNFGRGVIQGFSIFTDFSTDLLIFLKRQLSLYFSMSIFKRQNAEPSSLLQQASEEYTAELISCRRFDLWRYVFYKRYNCTCPESLVSFKTLVPVNDSPIHFLTLSVNKVGRNNMDLHNLQFLTSVRQSTGNLRVDI